MVHCSRRVVPLIFKLGLASPDAVIECFRLSGADVAVALAAGRFKQVVLRPSRGVGRQARLRRVTAVYGLQISMLESPQVMQTKLTGRRRLLVKNVNAEEIWSLA